MDSMMQTILQALHDAQVDAWDISDEEVSSAELFLIRRRLDMRRMKHTRKYRVTVYRDFEKDGKKMRGSSSVMLVPSQSKEEIERIIREAYYAAGFVPNPTYDFPKAETCQPMQMESSLAALSVEDAALKLADALVRADHVEGSVLNSAEIFVERHTVHFVSSWGTDVCYTNNNANGEYVAQCKQPQDVEMHHTFRFDELAADTLQKQAEDALRQVRDRAVAKPTLPTGTYTVILSDDKLAELFSYYTARSHAGMVFPGYSNWKPGTDVQPQVTGGERLNLTLHATVPYSDEGIAMMDRPLLQDGKVVCNHGGARLSSYLGVAPTGNYNAISCANGSMSLEQMKAEPYLYPVSFSDFQMDVMSGHFGGEIRLAYYFDGKQTHIVTGGSINGSIGEAGNDLVFSTERYDTVRYHGPFAVRLHNVKVAGTAE